MVAKEITHSYIFTFSDTTVNIENLFFVGFILLFY